MKDEYIERSYKSALHLNAEIGKGIVSISNDFTGSRLKNLYYLYVCEYYNHLISAKELTEFLYNLYKQADNSYSYDDLFKKFQITALFFYYLNFVSEEEFPQIKRYQYTKEIEADIREYVINIPNDVSRSHVSFLVKNFALGSNGVFDDFSYLKMLLSLTIFRHVPTYVHSVIVGKISFVITEYLAKYHPEEFIGIPGIHSTEDVANNLSELLLFVWYSSLVHDIGKIVYSHVVSFYVRKLNDKEFEMIKQHPISAEGFIRQSPSFSDNLEVSEILKPLGYFDLEDNPELFSYFCDIAYGHHKSYDGKFGYPQTFDNLSSPVKAIIDIVTVADSIDAATDSVGRSYANEKTLEDMREDLLSQIGDRYSPTIVKLIFENQDLYNAINKIIKIDRFDTYYSCFTTSDFSSTMRPPNKQLD